MGEILSVLKELGLEDNTFVIFTSDNGGGGIADNSPLSGRKSLLLEGGVRVPFIAKWPGKITEGTVSNEFCSMLEFFPTFLSAVGAEPPKGLILDGFDMLPVLRGEKQSERKEMYWQARYSKSARVGNWKWLDSPKAKGLFNLETDIGEKNDLSKEEPEKLEELKSKWQQWRTEMDNSEIRDPFRNY